MEQSISQKDIKYIVIVSKRSFPEDAGAMGIPSLDLGLESAS